MAERVELWWARRQFSKGAEVPYPVGTYREAWAAFPALIRQYHPELNAGIVLSQVPPAADVLLLWQCEAGHAFAATPDEQRHRPGRERRRSAWCPECTRGARPAPALPMRETVTVPSSGSPGVAGVRGAPDATAQRAVLRARKPKAPQRICAKTPTLPVGTPFVSECAPRPASAIEAQLRADLFGALALTPGLNAVRVARPFFDHVEVWPDIVLTELRVAIEYDSTGRHGLEHVGRRADADRRKDRALRAAKWEVVRIRTGKLDLLGPHDLQVSSWNRVTLTRLIDTLRGIRGPLLVDAYLA
ncbi:zinc-ribbon domain-containing protein [Microbacterium aurantiacum]|uniref:Zinc-ribbon domain-containing protein n=2 Tax=Microbacterium aurantiacum TaxID=162393 RepID=A0ABT8FW20_9MICO|nr:zinc-ribbon domain-containing protein [Microbacterium aurantiacum]MDN4465506.1 zinc-ribbon domain-containing protein [Microbacterium aurantiacum]